MKALFDTSVLVAAFVAAHPEHPRAFPWLQRVRSGEVKLVLCAHTLAELYSILTSLPMRPRLAPPVVQQILEELIAVAASVIELTVSDYLKVTARMVEKGLSGGTVYDGLIAHAAQEAGVDRLITLNERDFQRAWPEGRAIIVPP